MDAIAVLGTLAALCTTEGIGRSGTLQAGGLLTLH